MVPKGYKGSKKNWKHLLVPYPTPGNLLETLPTRFEGDAHAEKSANLNFFVPPPIFHRKNLFFSFCVKFL